jgi:hypothetical protein
MVGRHRLAGTGDLPPEAAQSGQNTRREGEHCERHDR